MMTQTKQPSQPKLQDLAFCYDGERTYYKDEKTGRMWTDKACQFEIDKEGKPVIKGSLGAAPSNKPA